MHLFPLCVYSENLAETNLSYEFGLFRQALELKPRRT